MGSDDGGLQVKFLALLPLLAPLLAACETTGGGSVMGTDCKVFPRPAYEIRGATQHDQDWIDPTIESGVGGCHWARPALRPVEWDAPKAPRHKVKVVPVPKAKPAWLRMLRSEPQPEAPAPAPEPSPPPVPRSPLDQLLHPVAK